MQSSSPVSPPETLPPAAAVGRFAAVHRVGRDRDDESRLLAALEAGDERAFAALIDRHHRSMVRLARAYVPSYAVAEEVAQETWETVVMHLDRFERRSTLKTWIFRILINRAKSRGVREQRTVPASCLGEADDASPTADPSLFQGPDGEYPDHWARPPRPWEDPERRLAALELRAELRAAIERLPERQRLVVALRDVDGMTAEEVCELLDLSRANQRVLLHRARATLRRSLDEQLAG